MLDNITNRTKEMVLKILDYLMIGCLFGLVACIFLITEGKHNLNVYRAWGYFAAVWLFIFQSLSSIVRGTIDTDENLDKKLDLAKFKVKLKELEVLEEQ
jgi:hypothetical protein